MFIYSIRNTINNKSYIGKTVNDINHRFWKHKYNASKGGKTYLYNAIRHYGPECFTIEAIDTASNVDELNSKEIEWIAKLSPDYNMTSGGEGGDTSSSPNYQTNKHKCGRPGELNGMFGKRGELSPNTGRKNTKQTIQLMSESHKQQRANNRVVCEHCHKDLDVANYKRWHGPKCKLKTKP